MAPAATIVSRNKMPPTMAATITQGKTVPVYIKQDKRQHTGASHSQIPALFEVEAKWIHEDASGITSSCNAHWWRPSNTQRGPTGEVPTFMAILMSGVWDADARWRAGRLWILKRSCHTKGMTAVWVHHLAHQVRCSTVSRPDEVILVQGRGCAAFKQKQRCTRKHRAA